MEEIPKKFSVFSESSETPIGYVLQQGKHGWSTCGPGGRAHDDYKHMYFDDFPQAVAYVVERWEEPRDSKDVEDVWITYLQSSRISPPPAILKVDLDKETLRTFVLFGENSERPFGYIKRRGKHRWHVYGASGESHYVDDFDDFPQALAYLFERWKGPWKMKDTEDVWMTYFRMGEFGQPPANLKGDSK